MSDVANLNGLLRGGDRRSIGRANDVAELVTEHPELLRPLLELMQSPDPLVRMRSADAAEKASRSSSLSLQEHAGLLWEIARTADQQEVRWHIAPMLCRVRWENGERRDLLRLLESYLQDRSGIVQVEALEAMVELAADDPDLLPLAQATVRRSATQGAPALRARARRLQKRLPPTDR